MNKRRLIYFLLIILTIPLGIGTRTYGSSLPSIIATYGGDVLASTCIFWGVRFVNTRSGLSIIALIAYLISIAIELLQLWQAEWLVRIRNTWAGGVLLGHGFLWSDWVCYAIGVLIAWLIAIAIERNIKPERLKPASSLS